MQNWKCMVVGASSWSQLLLKMLSLSLALMKKHSIDLLYLTQMQTSQTSKCNGERAERN